jgi:hypothetical protein
MLSGCETFRGQARSYVGPRAPAISYIPQSALAALSGSIPNQALNGNAPNATVYCRSALARESDLSLPKVDR